MLEVRELLDVALLPTGADLLLFGNGWARAMIKGFGSDLLFGGGGFIEIVGSCYILLVNPSTTLRASPAPTILKEVDCDLLLGRAG